MGNVEPIPGPRLEWSGEHLYVHRHGKRVYVGCILKDPFGEQWSVYVRGARKHTLSDEKNARRQLEAYA
jgi:hypothetical protein